MATYPSETESPDSTEPARRREAPVDRDEMIRRLGGARSATLGTVDHHGQPHLVPIVFAYDQGHLYTAVDLKPKSTLRLKRLANIEANPQVSVLVDHYDDDWSRLWWVRLDGTARVARSGPALRKGLALLAAKYDVYTTQPPPGPVIEVTVETARTWSAT
jgi:PPOX class probable F420-dependent enzyme